MDLRSDTQRHDQERRHTRDNESVTGIQQDQGEKNELALTCGEDRRRTDTEESDEDGYTREKEEIMTEKKYEKTSANET